MENDEFGSVVEDEILEFRLSELKETLKFRGSLEERYKNWLNKIHNNNFKFEDFDSNDENLNYDEREWFKEAVEVKKYPKLSIEGLKQRAYNYNKFYKKDNFDNADWTLYMKAAAEHKYKVIHDVLPQAGLNIG